MPTQPITILCLASECKGQPLLKEAKKQGARVLLLTEEKLADKSWPMDAIDERFLMPGLENKQEVMNAVSYLARSHQIDAIIPLDDYDVGTAAALREHMRLPGMGDTLARNFRDKLAMRQKAREGALQVPGFVGIFNYDDIRSFAADVPPPWVLKPRFEAGAIGIEKVYDLERLWRALDELGDEQSYFLVEAFVPGDVYHVDSIVWGGKTRVSIVSRYGKPPLSVSHEGGVFTTRTLETTSDDAQQLGALTGRLLATLGLQNGVAHSEFIKANATGEFYFLETAARVGGAHISDLIEITAGFNLWSEWAKITVASVNGTTYEAPQPLGNSGGLIICLAQQPVPDLSGYDEPEIKWRLDKPYHAGLIVVSPDNARVAALLDRYGDRFVADFLTKGPRKSAQRTQT